MFRQIAGSYTTHIAGKNQFNFQVISFIFYTLLKLVLWHVENNNAVWNMKYGEI